MLRSPNRALSSGGQSWTQQNLNQKTNVTSDSCTAGGVSELLKLWFHSDTEGLAHSTFAE
jgi:hypothetical protein